MSFFDGTKLLLFCYFSYFLLFKNAKIYAFYCFLSQIYVFFTKIDCNVHMFL